MTAHDMRALAERIQDKAESIVDGGPRASMETTLRHIDSLIGLLSSAQSMLKSGAGKLERAEAAHERASAQTNDALNEARAQKERADATEARERAKDETIRYARNIADAFRAVHENRNNRFPTDEHCYRRVHTLMMELMAWDAALAQQPADQPAHTDRPKCTHTRLTADRCPICGPLDGDNRPITDGDTAAPDPTVGLRQQVDQAKDEVAAWPKWMTSSYRQGDDQPAQGERLDPHTRAAADVVQERRRQVISEGYDESHDDRQVNQGLAMAAACYAAPNWIYTIQKSGKNVSVQEAWPWANGQDRRGVRHQRREVPIGNNCTRIEHGPTPEIRRQELVKAGALILAEIERLDRNLRDGGDT